ncbi:MAG TPA: energy transducer TonB [Stellaceae bacterium]|nr:energy transducer TonB [Stellaceae bacterium]
MPVDDLIERSPARPPDRPPDRSPARPTAPFEIAGAGGAAPEGGHPALVCAWAPFPVEFGGSWWLDPAAAAGTVEPETALAFGWAPFPVEFGQTWWLDPKGAAEPEQSPPPVLQRGSRWGLVGSLGVHLLPLLLLLGGTTAPAELAGAIPVQLVIERPAVESFVETPLEAAKSALPPAGTPPAETPPETKVATVPPKPAAPPEPPPKPVAIPPLKPSPPKPSPPKPSPPQPSPPKPRAEPNPPHEAPPHEAPPREAAPAPAARQPEQTASVAPSVASVAPTAAGDTGNGNYLDYLVTLTRRHADMLTAAFLAGRRGETVLSVVVLADGTIGSIAIKRSSGYPDIDARIQQMVAAVGRFPPPPARFQGPDLALDFKLIFPDAFQ